MVLDLTPNYLGSSSWFTPIKDDIEKLKVGSETTVLWSSKVQAWHRTEVCCPSQAAAEYWLSLGVSGIKVSDLAVASGSAEWPKLQAAVQTNTSKDGTKR